MTDDAENIPFPDLDALHRGTISVRLYPDLLRQSLDQYRRVLEQRLVEAYDLGLDLCVSELRRDSIGGLMIDFRTVAPDAMPPTGQAWTRYLTSQRTPEIEAAVAAARRSI